MFIVGLATLPSEWTLVRWTIWFYLIHGYTWYTHHFCWQNICQHFPFARRVPQSPRARLSGRLPAAAQQPLQNLWRLLVGHGQTTRSSSEKVWCIVMQYACCFSNICNIYIYIYIYIHVDVNASNIFCACTETVTLYALRIQVLRKELGSIWIYHQGRNL